MNNKTKEKVLPYYVYGEKAHKLSVSDMRQAFSDALKLFLGKPVMWLALFFTWSGLILVSNYVVTEFLFNVPLFSVFISLVISVLFAPGVTYCAHLQQHHGEFTVNDFIHIYSVVALRTLMILSGIALVGLSITIVLSVLFGEMLNVWPLLNELKSSPADIVSLSSESKITAFMWLFVSWLMTVPVVIGFVFTIPLVVLLNSDPLFAIKASMAGCIKNMVLLFITNNAINAILIVIGITVSGYLALFLLALNLLLGYQLFNAIYRMR